MPQNLNERSRDIMMPRSLFPIAAVIAIFLNTMLACTLVEEIWPAILCWICSGITKITFSANGNNNFNIFVGLLLFWRCSCCTCEGLFITEKDTAKTQQTSTTDGPVDIQKDQYIDTILIARWHDLWCDDEEPLAYDFEEDI